jgi:hypothetical protein
MTPEHFLQAASRWFADQAFTFTRTDPSAGCHFSADAHPAGKDSSDLDSGYKMATQTISLLCRGQSWMIHLCKPVSTLTAGSLQSFLDDLIQHKACRVDYIHGADVVRQLSEGGTIGLLLPALDKTAFFATLSQEGILPRKTFSMGEAREKRYYFECRRIV